MSIPISVPTNSYVKRVTDTLLRGAEDVGHVLSDPRAKEQLLGFGDYSLDFRLLVWTRHPSRHPQIKSDINYRIESLFREGGIEMSMPTQQFLLTTADADKLKAELGQDGKLDDHDSLPNERH